MVDLQRKLNAFNLLFDTSYGTLWWVHNQLWAQVPEFVIKAGTENGRHPGVSIQKEKPENTMIVPMLLGTSRKRSAYQAVALKMNDQEERFCYFGTLRPLDFTFLDFLGDDICANTKKKLSAEEQKKLCDFIRRRLSW